MMLNVKDKMKLKNLQISNRFLFNLCTYLEHFILVRFYSDPNHNNKDHVSL